MKNLILSALGLAAIVGGLSYSVHATPAAAAGTMLNPKQAMAIATKKIPGKAIQATYEFDEGHWVYGVMVVHDKKISEVELDPMTGKVGDTEDVDPAGEAKEMQQDLEKAIK